MASAACAIQFAFWGASPSKVALPAAADMHALIGVGNGLIPLGTLALLWALRREVPAAHLTAPSIETMTPDRSPRAWQPLAPTCSRR